MDYRALSGRGRVGGGGGQKVVNDLKRKVACEETNLSGPQASGEQANRHPVGEAAAFY